MIEEARKHDKDVKLLPAYEKYLAAITKKQSQKHDYINASFLAFIFQDFGVTRQHNIPSEVIDQAWHKVYSLLDEYEDSFDRDSESIF